MSVIVGFMAGRFGKVSKQHIATLLFYFIAPIVFFSIPASANIKFSYLGITFLTFIICSLLSILSYYLYGFIWQDSQRNILALSAGTGNSAFVMLPIATSMFDDNTLNIFALGLIGVSIYEVSVGCYYCARSINTFTKSVETILKLPILNSFIIGCIFSFMGMKLPDFFDDFVLNMKGAFSILGMVVIGIALAEIEKIEFDKKFIAAAFISKFVFAPAIFTLVVLFDFYVSKIYNRQYYDALLLLSLSPMATNVTILASLYNIIGALK
ncbi:MAG TPA: AEC family transporter [Candidatus Megaira endosymbiont of Hartmannula sinica]|nr:AEC family transporter [Candidatus Megaera endosymbiont of Hartmannula sinica]